MEILVHEHWVGDTHKELFRPQSGTDSSLEALLWEEPRGVQSLPSLVGIGGWQGGSWN